ncbi:hypothetical protein [Natronomonas gomsonensis]|uniref:hypothetical protein n=1 Tax=Natronomonas gomsonensis TaxID=1046043 RepID=UPI0015BBE4FC|nr:hypothetical protein [Natronomonas gomsonensis]
MTSRTLVGLLVVALGASLIVASGGFSAAEVDRNATVDVVDDPDALVGVETHDIEMEKQDHPDSIETDIGVSIDRAEAGTAVVFVYEDVPIVTVTNRAPASLSTNATVETEGDYPSVERHGTPSDLAVGESGNVTVDVKCPVVLTNVGDGRVEVSALDVRETKTALDIGADSPVARTTARMTRVATVECSFPGTTVQFDLLPDSALDRPGVEYRPGSVENASQNPTPVLED